jgi:AcrR family transcriptional regulator
MTTRDARRERTADRILQAARAEFAERGFEAATIRSIADRAGVHASLVMQHHGSKAALFTAAIQLAYRDDVDSPGHVADVLTERLGSLPPEVHALMRSMLTAPEATAIMRDYLQARIDRLTAESHDPKAEDAEARAVVIVGAIFGLTVARHFLDLPGFDRLGPEKIATVAANLLATEGA